MAVAAKSDRLHNEREAEAEVLTPDVRVADESAAAETVSPARALQDHLSHALTPPREKYSPRVVTMLVIMFCASTWVGGFLLYSMV